MSDGAWWGRHHGEMSIPTGTRPPGGYAFTAPAKPSVPQGAPQSADGRLQSREDRGAPAFLLDGEPRYVAHLQGTVLLMLMKSPRTPLSAEQMAETLGGRRDNSDDVRPINRAVSDLRRLFGPRIIHNVGSGYLIGKVDTSAGTDTKAPRVAEPEAARVKKRKQPSPGESLALPVAVQTSDGRLQCGELGGREHAGHVFYLDGAERRFTPVDADVLALAMENPGTPMSARDMADRLRGPQPAASDVRVMSHAIHKLRRELGQDIFQDVGREKFVIGTVGTTGEPPGSQQAEGPFPADKPDVEQDADPQPLPALMGDAWADKGMDPQ